MPPPPQVPPYAEIKTRNLIYHAYCPIGSFDSLANLRELRARWRLFNGRRLIAVAQGPGLLTSLQVSRILGTDADYLDFSNDPRARDNATFCTLLRAIASTDDTEATFHAHTKGTGACDGASTPVRRAIRRWRTAMYHYNLDNWARVARALRTHACAGIYLVDWSLAQRPLMLSPSGLAYGQWHYAGTFYWFRHDQIFRRPQWSAIPDDPWACEMWLGSLLPFHAAASLYQPWHPAADPRANLYAPKTHPRIAPARAFRWAPLAH